MTNFLRKSEISPYKYSEVFLWNSNSRHIIVSKSEFEGLSKSSGECSILSKIAKWSGHFSVIWLSVLSEAGFFFNGVTGISSDFSKLLGFFGLIFLQLSGSNSSEGSFEVFTIFREASGPTGSDCCCEDGDIGAEPVRCSVGGVGVCISLDICVIDPALLRRGIEFVANALIRGEWSSVDSRVPCVVPETDAVDGGVWHLVGVGSGVSVVAVEQGSFLLFFFPFSFFPLLSFSSPYSSSRLFSFPSFSVLAFTSDKIKLLRPLFTSPPSLFSLENLVFFTSLSPLLSTCGEDSFPARTLLLL